MISDILDLCQDCYSLSWIIWKPEYVLDQATYYQQGELSIDCSLKMSLHLQIEVRLNING